MKMIPFILFICSTLFFWPLRANPFFNSSSYIPQKKEIYTYTSFIVTDFTTDYQLNSSNNTVKDKSSDLSQIIAYGINDYLTIATNLGVLISSDNEEARTTSKVRMQELHLIGNLPISNKSDAFLKLSYDFYDLRVNENEKTVDLQLGINSLYNHGLSTTSTYGFTRNFKLLQNSYFVNFQLNYNFLKNYYATASIASYIPENKNINSEEATVENPYRNFYGLSLGYLIQKNIFIRLDYGVSRVKNARINTESLGEFFYDSVSSVYNLSFTYVFGKK